MIPSKSDYHEFYGRYISLVPEEEILPALLAEFERTKCVVEKVPEDLELFVHDPYKWTVRQVMSHMIDAERVFADRAHRISRGDETHLPSFDEMHFAAESGHAIVPLRRLYEEFAHLRKANELLFQNLSEKQWARRGTACNSPVTVSALSYMMLGHERHHMNIVRKRFKIS